MREFETNRPHWFFQGVTRDNLAKFLGGLDLSDGQLEQLLRPTALHEFPNGVDVEPTAAVVLNIAPAARRAIYKLLANSDSGGLVYVPTKNLDERFRKNHVSSDTIALFNKCSCSVGRSSVFTGMSYMLSAIPNYDEKVHFLQSLMQQETLLIYLQIPPHSDVAALTRYWGKSSWTADVKPMLESLAENGRQVPLDINELLPPIPEGLLYTYPVQQNPMNGPTIRQDCFWTAFNFFRDIPDNNFTNVAYTAQKLREDYIPVYADPRYGDLVLYTGLNDYVIHAAVFIADDIVYTKNGYGALYPWHFTTIKELAEIYSFSLPPNQTVHIRYFRNKYS